MENTDEETAGGLTKPPAVSHAATPSATPESAETAVSRETVPKAASAVFGGRLGAAELYARSLATVGVERGLIGPREADRVWQRHLLNCAALEELIAPDSDVLDLGSGAGLPGIPLAIARPDLWVTMVDPMERRVAYLEEVIAQLELPNVEVVRARAEEVTPVGKADVVTSRAVAPLSKLAQWCLPLARPGGEMLAIKGASAEEEAAAHAGRIPRRLGSRPEVVRCGGEYLDTPTTVIRVCRR